MSLGFLTESALLPSKAKPIKVDGKSLVDLKAVVYEREQQLRDADVGGNADDDVGALRRQRGGRLLDERARKQKDDMFSRPNRGVTERNQRDEHANSGAKRRRAGMMQAKADLYEKLAAGGGGASSDSVLIDFSRKSVEDVEILSRAPEEAALESANPDEEVEIVDEFGRSRTVKRGSAEARSHRKWLREQAERRRHTTVLDARSAEELERKAAAAVRQRVAAAAGAPLAGFGSSGRGGNGDAGGSAWAWGSGDGHAGAGDWRGEAGDADSSGGGYNASKKVSEVLEEMADVRGGGGGGGVQAEGISAGARVLSAWEKGLKGDEKAFLDGIRKDTLEGRAKGAAGGGGAEERKRQLEDRRELLRRKRQKMGGAQNA